MDSVKGLIILVIAGAVVGLSLMFQPWSELGFAVESDKVPIWAKPLADSGVYKALEPTGQQITAYLKKQTGAEEKGEGATTKLGPLVIGNYTYALSMGAAMMLAAFAIILIGRDDAEEKTVLPAKK